MKTIGLIGGMSWESTSIYYALLNRLARERLGGLHSAELMLYSFDFARIEALQTSGDWAAATAEMVSAAKRLAAGNVSCILICTNTMHMMADAVAQAAGVPVLHVADATGAAVREAGCVKPLLLATRYTMEKPFYMERLSDRHGLDVVVPATEDRTLVHDVIYDELCRGIVREASRARYLEVIDRAASREGVDGVIFGCTEVGMLLSETDVPLPTFDTTAIHAKAAIDFALADA